MREFLLGDKMLVEKLDNYLKNQKKDFKKRNQEMEEDKDFYFNSYLSE